MNEFVTTNWPLLAIGALIALVMLWWIVLATRKTRVAVDRRDTLDEGAARAARNQALIDAAPAAAQGTGVPLPPATPDVIGGIGVAIAAAVEQAEITRDDLTQIKGLGPRLAATLHDLGVHTFSQIAAWTDADIDRIDPQLGRFAGRIRRDAWTEQARFLAAGDAAGFAARFGAR